MRLTDKASKFYGRVVQRLPRSIKVAGATYYPKWEWSKWYRAHVTSAMRALSVYPDRSHESVLIDVAYCVLQCRHNIDRTQVASIGETGNHWPNKTWAIVKLVDGTEMSLNCSPRSAYRPLHTSEQLKLDAEARREAISQQRMAA